MQFSSIDDALQFLANEIAVTQRAVTILAHALDIAGAIDIEGYAKALDLPDAGEDFRQRIAVFCESLRVDPTGWNPMVIDGGKDD